MSENIPQTPVMPVKLAMIIDNEVVDILHTDERLASILLSEPVVIDITNAVDQFGNFTVKLKSKYNSKTQTFTDPE